jgi:hypothetical protein
MSAKPETHGAPGRPASALVNHQQHRFGMLPESRLRLGAPFFLAHSSRLRMKNLLLMALLAGLSVPAAAETQLVDACSLLTPQDLSPWYPKTNEVRTPIEVPAGAAGAPIAFHADSCMHPASRAEGSGEVVMTVETYPAKAPMGKVAAWLKSLDANPPKDGEVQGLKRVQVGKAVCESGHYTQKDRDQNDVVYHYVACDQLVKNHHVALTLEWPTDPAKLPSVAQAKGLLDLMLSRLP